MTTRVGMERKARFQELARRAFAPSSWRWRAGGYVAKTFVWLGSILTLVGAIARWGALVVGPVLLLVALCLALLDELATPAPRPPSELEVDK